MNKKRLISIIAAVILVAAAIAAIVVYRKEIVEFLTGAKNKIEDFGDKVCKRGKYTVEEYNDFADI